jgi:hypothetical protein
VREAPDAADFDKAAVWNLTIPKDALEGCENLFLDIDYTGDIGRLYAGTELQKTGPNYRETPSNLHSAEPANRCGWVVLLR